MDEGEPAAPTELAGVAEADTMSAWAWSEDDSLEDVPSTRPFWLTAAAVGVSLCLVTVAGVIAYRYTTADPAPVALTAPATTTTVVPVAAPRPVPPPPPVTVTTVVVESKVAAPPPPQAQAHPVPVMSRWSYDVRWGGVYGITVIEHAGGSSQPRYVTGGENLGVGTGWTGEVIGADPVIDSSIGWAECTLYIDGVVAKRDYASSGDGHDVSCLMRLTQ